MGDVVFLADGAPWIWKWVEAHYPESTQILDFYHVKEHLCRWAEYVFKDTVRKQEWIDRQCLLLLNDRVDGVILNIQELKAYSKRARAGKKALLDYCSTHRDGMKYKTYRENNLMIGSGPIEAAHRHVIQQRMKLSGQRWTRKGAQQIANLRVVYRSKMWCKIVQMAKMAA